jgi:inner membrane protein
VSGFFAAAKSRYRLLAGCIVLANLPDIDFLPGILIGSLNTFHHGFTHSLGWILLVSTGLWCLSRSRCDTATGVYVWIVMTAVLFSHLVADFFCEDRGGPFGILLWWPFSSRYIDGSPNLFFAMEKSSVAAVLTFANVGPAMWEAFVGGVFLAAVIAWKTRRRSGT